MSLKDVETTYRGPAPCRETAPIGWEVKLFLLALALAFAVWSFWQWVKAT